MTPTAASAWRRVRASLLTPPALILLVIVVLGLLRVNGSSVALHDATDPGANTALEARPNRNDEWQQRTPMVIRQARNDFPRTTDLGLGVHDAGVLSDLPVRSFSAVIKPHTWAYFVVGVERAFAFEWWFVVLGPLLGVYAVLATITRTRAVPLLAGALVAVSPVAAWWAIPAMGCIVLYGCLTTTMVLLALRRRGWRRALLGAGAGWAAACLVATLYVPWIVPIAIIMAAVVISQLRGTGRERMQWVLLGGSFAAVFGVLMALFLKQHQAAIQAISDTVYPGRRETPSGAAVQSLVFGAPFDVFTTTRPFELVTGTNQTEAASGLMLWLPIAIAGGSFAGWRRRDASARALAAVMSAAMVLAAWALLPVPSGLGALLGLTKVQGQRLALPLTVAGAMAAGLYVHRFRTDGSFRPTRSRLAVAIAVFVFVTARAGAELTIDGKQPDRVALLALVVAASVAVALVLRGRVLAGLGGACVLLLFSTVRVNPIQIGLGPVLDDPLLAQIDAIRTADPSARWATIGAQDGHPRSILMASGAPSVTGVSWYPIPDVWHRIDPTDASEPTWNRYALVSIVIDPTIADIAIDQPADDAVVIRTPACGDGALQRLDVRFAVSDVAVAAPCLDEVAAPSKPGERWIYEVK